MRRLKTLIEATTVAVMLVFGTPALAAPVQLKANPTDDDGRVTLAELFDGTDSQAVVATRTGASALLDAARLQQLARANGVDWANSTGVQRVVVRGATLSPSGAVPVLANASVTQAAPAARVATADALTYARNIAAGETVTAADLVYAPVQAQLVPQDAPRDSDAVEGQQARRPLRQGAPVSARDLVAAKVIHRGEMIELAFEAEGIRLTLQARALADASPGQMLTVLNVASNKTLQATAVSPGHALVGAPGRNAQALQLAAR